MGIVTTEPIFGFDQIQNWFMLCICPVVDMADNSPPLPESTPFAMWLCWFSHQGVESISSFLRSELALWLAVANRMWWKWGCLVLNWSFMLPCTPLEPCCHRVPGLWELAGWCQIYGPVTSVTTANSHTTTRHVSVATQDDCRLTTDGWLSPVTFSWSWPRLAKLPSWHTARWAIRNPYYFSVLKFGIISYTAIANWYWEDDWEMSVWMCVVFHIQTA